MLPPAPAATSLLLKDLCFVLCFLIEAAGASALFGNPPADAVSGSPDRRLNGLALGWRLEPPVQGMAGHTLCQVGSIGVGHPEGVSMRRNGTVKFMGAGVDFTSMGECECAWAWDAGERVCQASAARSIRGKKRGICA